MEEDTAAKLGRVIGYHLLLAEKEAQSAVVILALALEYSQGAAEVVVDSTAVEHALVVASFLAEGEEGSMVNCSAQKLQYHQTSCAEKVGRSNAASLDCRYLELLECTVGQEEERMNLDVLVAEAAVVEVTLDAVTLLLVIAGIVD